MKIQSCESQLPGTDSQLWLWVLQEDLHISSCVGWGSVLTRPRCQVRATCHGQLGLCNKAATRGSLGAKRQREWACGLTGRERVRRGATRSSPSPTVGCTDGVSQVLTGEAEIRDSHGTASGVIPDCLLPPSETQGLKFSGWSGKKSQHKVTDHYLHPN